MVTTADIDKVNQKNLKALENGGTIDYLQIKNIVAIGKGHNNEIVAMLTDPKHSDACNKGKITIAKGKLTDPGKLKVTGAKTERSQFQDAIKRISKKTVEFV